MEVPLFLDSLEQYSLIVWFRESQSLFAYYFVLMLHTIGLSLIVGPNAAIDLRLLGVAREIPIAPMKRWFGLMWFGLALNAVSGILLALTYPVKTFTNPMFYVKLILIGFAVVVLQKIKAAVFADPAEIDVVPPTAKTLAIWSLVLWASVLGAGRLLAYTCNYLLYAVPC